MVGFCTDYYWNSIELLFRDTFFPLIEMQQETVLRKAYGLTVAAGTVSFTLTAVDNAKAYCQQAALRL